MFNQNNGYIGASMSVRAAACYAENIKPKSQWSKDDILCSISQLVRDQEINVNFNIELLRKLNVNNLKDLALAYDSWHHTGSYFNQTDFYRINIEALELLKEDEIINLLESQKKEKEEKKAKKEEPKEKKARVKYATWSGTRKHPKAEWHEEICVIDSNWAYTSLGKKKLSGNYTTILERL